MRLGRLISAAMVLAPASLLAGPQALAAPPAPVRAVAAQPLKVLFVGNSFTQGALSAVRNWHADRVTDLNGAGFGGVPALFREFADQVGRPVNVSLETQGGKSLAFHLAERRALIDRSWDVVVLQEYSTLDPQRPGDPAASRAATAELVGMLRARNPQVRIYLMATWTRADQTYPAGGAWAGKPVSAMALDLRRAADKIAGEVPGIAGVIPVGQAWNRAFDCAVADPNPYDGIAPGQVNLWSYDHYHGSIAGYYLEALVVFGAITGIDPATLGSRERAADQLGLSVAQAAALQGLARRELSGTAAAPVAGKC